MERVRAFSPHVKWTESEVNVLKSIYVDPDISMGQMPDFLNGRTKSQIQNRANRLGLKRPVKPKMAEDEVREAKRLQMAKARAANPEKFRARGRARHAKNKEANKEKMREYYKRRFFWSRAMKLRGDGGADFVQLARLWKDQRGKCALSGVKLGRDAQLDHITAKALGGGDEIANLQWLSPEVNLAKRDLTPEHFIEMCRRVVALSTTH
jgi:5-methylcytosine-specific restriction endonuclease McrA